MIQFKRGEKTEDKSSKPLAAGQPFIDTNKHELWIGSDDTTGTLAKANKVVDTNALWLSGGEAISATQEAHADLNDEKYKKVGNYYMSGADNAQHVDNFPSFITKEAFILTVYAGNGLGYPCQRLRTLNHRAVAERWYNSDSTANRWEDWRPVPEYSYQVRSTQALERSEEGSKWVPYAAEGTALCHLPYLTAEDFSETSDGTNKNNTKLFFFCLLSLLFEKGFANNSYVGISSPNSTGNTLVYLYSTLTQTLTLSLNGVDYKKTLPMNSEGVFIDLAGDVRVFGTYKDNFYCNKVDSRFADTPTGFNSRFTSTEDSWPLAHRDLSGGNIITGWRWIGSGGTKGDVAFVGTTKDSYSNANIILDGSIYVNEGINKVVTSNESNAGATFVGTGSAKQPVYLDASNKIQPCTYKTEFVTELPTPLEENTIYYVTEK